MVRGRRVGAGCGEGQEGGGRLWCGAGGWRQAVVWGRRVVWGRLWCGAGGWRQAVVWGRRVEAGCGEGQVGGVGQEGGGRLW